MSWIDKIKAGIDSKKAVKDKDLWAECKKCGEQIYIAELETNLNVCPHCDYHFRLATRQRIHQLVDQGTFKECDPYLASADPLKFKDTKKYKDRIKSLAKKGVPNDAVVTGCGSVEGLPIEICVFDFSFMGGSMGSVVGEKITRAIERATANNSALVIASSSGGARMQEGIFSLMQMVKTSSALSKLSETKTPYISILTDPTMGGVSASFSMLGDVILAEPGALIGFAGPRVIQQTLKQKLPEGFQTAEFLLEHGLIDNVVHRKDLKPVIARLLQMLKNNSSGESSKMKEPRLTKPAELLGA